MAGLDPLENQGPRRFRYVITPKSRLWLRRLFGRKDQILVIKGDGVVFSPGTLGERRLGDRRRAQQEDGDV